MKPQDRASSTGHNDATIVHVPWPMNSAATAQVFTGSSNLSPSGEEGNGDNLVVIQDQKVATSYAIEALRIFDHLHFRVRMQNALAGKKGKVDSGKTAKQKLDELTLQKPSKFSGKPAWFDQFYKNGSQAEADRLLFSK
jgi:phosphatidylserine/phosphatidylglycerophosphate/cardiolipin synthase-like enzyme